jgi:AraC family transcriptional regulator
MYPKISFQISIKGEVAMKFRIEKMKEFKLAGVSREISIVNEENFKAVPKMWDDVCADGTCEIICGMNKREKEEMYGVCYNFNFPEEKFRYMIAVKPEKEIPGRCEVLDIPELTWVKFECNGVSAIQDAFKRMYSEWFPTSGYEHDDGPEIEWYSTDDMSSPDYKCEVWVPIKPSGKNIM